MEEGKEKNDFGREEIFSKSVKAGKRTYFLDVKATKRNEYYLTITESKKRIDDDGKFFFEKHKVFLYQEDFDKFTEGLTEVINYIKEMAPEPDPKPAYEKKPEQQSNTDTSFSNVNFEDLDK